MLELNRMKCCGLRELHGIQIMAYLDGVWKLPDPCHVIAFVQREMKTNSKKGAFVTFAAAKSINADATGTRLAEYITEHKLGALSELDEARNPNSGHMLGVWLWRIHWRNLSAWKPVQKAVKKPPAKPARK